MYYEKYQKYKLKYIILKHIQLGGFDRREFNKLYNKAKEYIKNNPEISIYALLGLLGLVSVGTIGYINSNNREEREKREREKREREEQALRIRQIDIERTNRVDRLIEDYSTGSEYFNNNKEITEKAKQKRLEQERLEYERQKQERLEQERIKQERIEQIRLQKKDLPQNFRNLLLHYNDYNQKCCENSSIAKTIDNNIEKYARLIMGFSTEINNNAYLILAAKYLIYLIKNKWDFNNDASLIEKNIVSVKQYLNGITTKLKLNSKTNKIYNEFIDDFEIFKALINNNYLKIYNTIQKDKNKHNHSIINIYVHIREIQNKIQNIQTEVVTDEEFNKLLS